MPRLTDAQLNRTYLERQRLLTPSTDDALTLIRHLGAVQAQEGPAPYFALWARLASFQRGDLDELRHGRQVVRAHLHRNTVHLLDADAFLLWYPLYRQRLEAQIERWGPSYRPPHSWLDRLTTALDSGPQRPKTVVQALERLLPSADPTTVRPFHLMAALELVRLPGEQGESVGTREVWATSQSYLGRRPGSLTPAALESMITRYLAAYGPASAADFSAWAGLPSQRATFEQWAKEDRLAVYEDSRGRRLYDVRDAVMLTGGEEVREVQLLADFDNAILSHQDRTRIVDDTVRTQMNKNLRSMAPLMVRGRQVGVWQVSLAKGRAPRATLEPFVKITKAQRRALEDLAMEALAMAAPGKTAAVAWR